jgi:hypothetical protein
MEKGMRGAKSDPVKESDAGKGSGAFCRWRLSTPWRLSQWQKGPGPVSSRSAKFCLDPPDGFFDLAELIADDDFAVAGNE